MTTRFADHLLTGTHASRPAATVVPAGTLYSCTTHGLIYQSDGAIWTTYATLGGTETLGATIIDAKGDLVGGTAADTPARLAVGTNAQVLTADSAESTGMKWATPSAGSAGALTLIQTITRGSTGTIDFTSIAGTYNDLIVTGLIRSSRGTALTNAGLLLNNDNATNYAWSYLLITGTSVSSSASTTGQPYTPYVLCAGDSAAAGVFTAFRIEILNYAAATGHKYLLHSYATMDPAGTMYHSTGGSRWHPGSPAAITRVTLWDNVLAASSFITGSTVRLYGRT